MRFLPFSDLWKAKSLNVFPQRSHAVICFDVISPILHSALTVYFLKVPVLVDLIENVKELSPKV